MSMREIVRFQDDLYKGNKIRKFLSRMVMGYVALPAQPDDFKRFGVIAMMPFWNARSSASRTEIRTVNFTSSNCPIQKVPSSSFFGNRLRIAMNMALIGEAPFPSAFGRSLRMFLAIRPYFIWVFQNPLSVRISSLFSILFSVGANMIPVGEPPKAGIFGVFHLPNYT